MSSNNGQDQNSYVERFNKTYRNEILDFYLFSTLTEVKEITRTWIKEYNEERPHDSLGKMTPAEFVVAHSTDLPPLNRVI